MFKMFKNFFKFSVALVAIANLSACSKSTSSTDKSSSQSTVSSSQTTSSSSSSAPTHSPIPAQEDLTYTIWYSEGENNYLVFDDTTVTRRMAHPAQDAIGRPHPTSYPYSINGSIISFDFGMTGVDDQFVMS
jgi:hypothetical protein